MIDPEVFSREWEIMQSRFDKKFSEAVIGRYYQVLSKQLTTEQFLAACLAAFTEDEFFPTPEKLVSRVKPDFNQLALEAWDRVLAAASRSSRAVALCEAGERALRSVGGLSGIGYADVHTQLPHLRRNFLEAFKTCADAQMREERVQALPAGAESVKAIPGIENIGRSLNGVNP